MSAAGAAGALPLHDGVVVDADRGVAYLARAGGGLAAVELATGAERWSSDAAIRPLTLAGDRLIAQGVADPRGALTLVALDAATGTVGRRAELPLPDGVSAAAQRGGTVFHLVAKPADGRVQIAWKAVRGSAGGWLPSAQEGAVPAVDDKTGRAAEAYAGEPSLVEITGAAIFDPRSGEVRMSPVASKASLAAPARLVELADGGAKARAGGERRFLSIDGRHVLISARQAAGSERATPWQRYRWTVVERASGERLGQLDHHLAVVPFVVADGRLIFVEPRHARRTDEGWQEMAQTLRAVDLGAGKGGTDAWAKSVEDLSSTGPFAP